MCRAKMVPVTYVFIFFQGIGRFFKNDGIKYWICESTDVLEEAFIFMYFNIKKQLIISKNLIGSYNVVNVPGSFLHRPRALPRT